MPSPQDHTTEPKLGNSDVAIIKELLCDDGMHTSADSLAKVSTKLKETRSLKQTVEYANWLGDDKLLARLTFLERLCEHSQGKLALVYRIVMDSSVSPVSIGDVARHVYRLGLTRADAPASDDQKVLDGLRKRLFVSEPTALICGFVDGGIIPLAPDLREHVLAVLDYAIQISFDISKQPARVLLGDDQAFKSIPLNQQSEVKNMISAMIRLHVLVDDPDNIAVLLSHQHLSAYSISEVPQGNFLQTMKGSGVDAATADAIWTRANAARLRTQEVVVERLRGKHEIRFNGALQYKSQDSFDWPIKGPVDLSKLFPDLDQVVDCCDCCSLTSPAAYFVDLLYQLGKRAIDQSQPSDTLLDKLFSRRPDLGDLQLSCANTKVLIPYIDLVNEALESVVAKAEPKVTDPYNEDDGDDVDDDETYIPGQNTNHDVYKNYIQPLVFPLTTFPYNEAIDSIRTCFQGLGSSRNELLTIFRAPYRLVPKATVGNHDILSIAEVIADRAASAEYLGLTADDYIAIVHESFQTKEYLDLIKGSKGNSSVESYRDIIGVKTPGEYWGYPNDQIMLSEAEGLTLLSGQFLPRAGVSFDETLNLLNTGYFNGQLAITSGSEGKEEFSGKVAEMRLRSYLLDSGKSSGLTATQCDDLQAFLRLWRKVGWPLEDLDAAVVMLRGNRPVGIDPEIIDGLAEIKRISAMTGLPVGDILPLWGDMDTNSTSSVYARIFLQRRVAREDDIFEPDKEGKYLPGGSAKISEHRQIIRSTLRLSDAELDAILRSAASWIGDSLTIRSISYIYRVSVFCQVLEVSPVQYIWVLSLLPLGFNIFQTPRVTRSVLEQFQQLKRLGWSIDSEVFAAGGIMDGTGEWAGFDINTAVRATADIVEGNSKGEPESVLLSLRDDTKPGAYTREQVAIVAAALFGTDIGGEVERFIEGTHTTTSDIAVPVYVGIPLRLRHKIQLAKNHHGGGWLLHLTGFLSQDEEDELVKHKEEDKTWACAIHNLQHRSTSPYNHFSSLVKSSKRKKLFFEVGSGTNRSWSERAEQLEKQALGRREAFLTDVAPILDQKIRQKTVLKVLGSVVPDLDVAILQTLLTDVITIKGDDQKPVPAIQALCDLTAPDPAMTAFDGYFLPSGTDSYTFASTSYTKPIMFLNGFPVSFIQVRNNTGAPNAWASNENLRLAGNELYSLQLSKSAIKDLSFRAGKGTPASPLSPTLVAQRSVKQVSEVLVKLRRVAIPVSLCKLQREEIEYFQSLHGSNLITLSFENIKLVSTYADLRNSLPKPGGKDAISPLTNFYKSLNECGTVEELVTLLVRTTGWPGAVIDAVLRAKYLPALTESQLVETFKHFPSLCQLRDVMGFMSRLRLEGLFPELLFSLADPALPQTLGVGVHGKAADKDFEDANRLRLALASRGASLSQPFAESDERLRANRRTALVQYLLQQEYIRKLDIHDPDALCEYLLIDVQMGPSLRTSRLKQATSTIQTFMQRCIIGLEKRFGIPSSVISRGDYEYLGRYRLWEANRKTFMYPESWIDPTLRDDKTDQFRDLEAAITQGKVTEDSMAGVIRDYVFAMHEVGNLEVQGYVWGKEEDGKTSRLHLFGRTRTSPWKYYYRSVDIVENGKKSVTYWKPWERLSVEIQSHELTDNAPNKRADQPNDDGFDKFNKYTGSGCYMVPRVLDGRLILFLPQFTLVDLFDDESKKTTPTKMANEPVSKSTTMKQWQLQMGWTEYRNGKWTPKKLCPDVLLINGEINDYRPTETDDEKVEEQEEEIRKKLEAKLPGIQTFFFPDSYTWEGIAVQTWYGPLNPGCPIREEELYGKRQKKYYRFHYRSWGAFSWRGESLVLVRQRDWSADEAVPTNFAKLAWPVTDAKDGNFLVPANGGLELPARSPTPKHEADNVFTLGLSRYFSNSVCGSVLDVVLQDGDSQCFIYYDSRWDSGKFSNLVSSALVRAATRGTDELYSKLSSIDTDFYEEHDDVFGKRGRIFPHELANPFSLYTWEVGVHAISLIMERFLSTQQYELALSAARFLFDPAAAGVDADFTKCWKFIPFQTLGIVLKHPGIMPDPKASVHAVAREWPAAYMKRVVLKYIEILIALGDELFRQNTLETIPLAIQRYIEAEHLFGPQPVNTPQLGKRKVWSYKKLMGGKIDEFSNFSVDLELELPFRWDSGDPKKLIPFINTAYFCIPANPQVAGLRALLNDRLYKCRNSLDIDGHKQNLALFEPAIDPDALLRAKAAGLSPSAVVGDLSSPMPRSRFVYLLEQALELCRELKEMEARVLAVKEKKDTEALAALSAKHNTAMLGLVMETKRAQKEEALAAIAVLEENRRSQIARLAFYLVLTGDQMPPLDGDAGWKEIPQSTGKPTADGLRISATERSEMVSAIQSIQHSEAGNELEQLARIFDALPAISLNFEPLGVGTTVECGPAIVARAMRIGVGEAMNRAQSSSDKSRMSNMVGRFESQLQERRELANQAGREIKVIDRMLAGARARVAACEKDIQQQQQQLDAAAEMEEWLRSKYTSVELYAWMDKQYGMLFQRGYSLTTALVRQAQRAYFFENPTDSSQFLNSAGYWDGARDGLLSAENMWLDLKKMDLAFRNKKSHDFEIVKNISLRQLNPWALVELRETGQTKFSLPEFLFDMDFPGHYCRRINSVSLTIPCIVGPYTSLNCTLRLCQHTYRISTDISLPYPEKMAGDLRFRTDSIPINAIAIGSPAPNDRSAQGSFSFGFVGNRYSPFEGAGAISTWQIELPPDLRQFEYRTISDVVLQLRYTALDGGSLFGNAASKSVMDAIKQQSSTALSMLVSIPSDYTSTWATFQSEMRSGKEGHLHLQDMPDRLPFWTQRRKIMVDSISVIVFPATEDLDLCKMTIGEYEGLSWTKQDQGLGDGCMVFEAKPTGKELKQNWTVTVPNPDGKRVSLDALWVLVHYYVSAS